MKKTMIAKLGKITSYMTSAASLIFAAQFLYHIIYSSFAANNWLWITLTIVASILVMFGLRTEFTIIRQTKLQEDEFQICSLLKSLAIIMSSAMISHMVANVMNTTTIFAASLVCFIFTFLFLNYEAESYSGAVAGMMGTYLYEHWSIVFLTAISTGIVFILFKSYFKGVGGRGGAISYMGTMLVVRLFLQVNPIQNLPIDEKLIIPSFILLLFAAFLTYYFHKNKFLTVVKSAMILVLISSIIIPNSLYPLTSAVFAGTIVGMSSEPRIENYHQLFIVVLISFILFIPSFHILDGIGGKLGILGLLSYYGSVGLKDIYLFFKPQNSDRVTHL